LAGHGFAEDNGRKGVFLSRGTNLFPLRFQGKETVMAIRVDDIESFRSVWSILDEITGERYAPLRTLMIMKCEGVSLIAVERRGCNDFEVAPAGDVEHYASAIESLRNRDRGGRSDETSIEKMEGLVARFRGILDPARLADAFERSEIEYWQSRNSAARLQAMAQDELGMGWANRDHLTFRSSRGNFHRLIRLLEVLGFEPRERFYAGDIAGWGAQIMEHPTSGTVVFADVDLAPEENSIDFAHGSLPELERQGTVGQWVALHGESILHAGMHHMAARMDFDRARSSLLRSGVGCMDPFSDFTFLRQLFTIGETWRVDEPWLDGLRKTGHFDKTKLDEFMMSGAVGSHLELIQRAWGFKGFNQNSVTAILNATNPSTYQVTQA
ncbi:MAG: hypothetical protein LUO85_01590, partial [Methanomassiliicoccales archaeon]|nr:hypothetical protein [Methanomassiliicoccales archaeon]